MGCTGDRCPMQAPFDFKSCQTENCYFRTEGYGTYGTPKRILMMSALEKWGGEAQTRKLSEEMAELWVEICHIQLGRGETDKLAEEIADVRIMLDQIELLTGSASDCEQIRTAKLDRQIQRINGEVQ